MFCLPAVIRRNRAVHGRRDAPFYVLTAMDSGVRRGYLRKPCRAETILALLRRLAHDEPSSNC